MHTLALRIQQFFNPLHPAPIEHWQGFAEKTQLRRFKKNEIVKKAGNTERYLSFVTEGIGGTFAYKEGHEVCLDISLENQFLSDYASFLQQQASPIFTLAIESLELYSIAYTDLQALYSASIGGVHLARAAAEALFIENQRRQLDLLTKSAEERYREIFEMYPEVLLRLPQKHIASYLGITPESLSRIRKSIARL